MANSPTENPSAPPLSREPTAQSPFPRCSHCSRSRQDTRNIVVCIDGTSSQFGLKNTNVVKLFSKICKEMKPLEQHAYYSSGIGTRPKSLRAFDRMARAVSDKFDVAIAWNAEEIVKDAYGWLARMYQEGDHIYLFGFSRGAYQVRMLAAMIHEVGLIRTPTEKQIGTAYDHYTAIRFKKGSTARQIMREFKNTFSWKDLKVHFVGAWDTVSSVGLGGNIFLSASLTATHVCHFRHALALDEHRVKFMPEYFHEMNSQTHDNKYKRWVHSMNMEESTMNGEAADVREVWFAGSHSDVGGTNRPGKPYHAGNVSLLWMRREAATHGLVLQPADMVWVPDDLDFGTSNSMTWGWKFLEWLPFKHQTYFSGPGENTRRRHLSRPRRFIPGQKVHASIWYANTYQQRPLEGFDIPQMQVKPGGVNLDDDIWETTLFDETAAQELLTCFDGQQRTMSVYLDRLLFLLRFDEGKECIRNVQGWETRLTNVIEDAEMPLVRLIALVTYYEVGAERLQSPWREPEDNVLDNAQTTLCQILTSNNHQDDTRVVALLRPLTNHKTLRERILTELVLGNMMNLFDQIIYRSEGSFGQAMDGLNCLLQCEFTRKTVVHMLKEPSQLAGDSDPPARLYQILLVRDTYLLIPALRVVLTFARISKATRSAEEARAEEAQTADDKFWSAVKLRTTRLVETHGGPVGTLAAQILLVLGVEVIRTRSIGEAVRALVTPPLRRVGASIPTDRWVDSSATNASDRRRLDEDSENKYQLDFRNQRIRTNVSTALLSFKSPKRNMGDGRNVDEEPEQQIFRQLFGLGADRLEPRQERLISELQKAIERGSTRKRSAATLTLLNLCETESIRSYLYRTKLLGVFVDQLRQKDTALLAAYALVTCLKYDDMKYIGKSEVLPKNIVHMLQMDYFDDAVGNVEGFQIFKDLIQHDELREKIKTEEVAEVMDAKLGKDKPREVRTSMICLDIFLATDPKGPLTDELVKKGLNYLRSGVWKKQKAGVMTLSALAQTEHGSNTIRSHMSEIIKMFSRIGDHLPNEEQASISHNVASRATQHTVTPPTVLQNISKSPPVSSWMMGPACALWALAHNSKSCLLSFRGGAGTDVQHVASEELREYVRKTKEYGDLKHLYLNERLVSDRNTSPWYIRTPNRNDVTRMLEKMFDAVDGEVSEDLMSTDDLTLPHIEHWDRLVALTCITAIAPSALVLLIATHIGISALVLCAAFAVIGITPVMVLAMFLYFPVAGYKKMVGRPESAANEAYWKQQ